MARKPNYGFEKREREKAKAQKKADRLAARQARKAAGDTGGTPETLDGSTDAAPGEGTGSTTEDTNGQL